MEYTIHQDHVPKNSSNSQEALISSSIPSPFTYPSLPSQFTQPSPSYNSYTLPYSNQMPTPYFSASSQQPTSYQFAASQTTDKSIDQKSLHQFYGSHTSLTGVEWGSETQKVICPFCNEETETKVQTSRIGKAWCLCCAMCAIGLWPCCLIPLYCKNMKAIIHKCTHCHIVLGRHAE